MMIAFPETLNFEPFTARQDRILASFRDWTFEGTVEEFAVFGNRLSREYEEAGKWRKLFNKPSGMLPFSPRWSVSGGKQGRDFIREGVPLFGGQLRGHLVERIVSRNRLRWRLAADLALNPTRWVMFEPSHLQRLPKSDWIGVPPNMFATNSRSPIEPSLTGGGNVVSGSQRRQALAHPSNWRLQVERYIDGTLDYLDQRLKASTREAGGLVRRQTDRITLKAIETYWEIGATSALEFVRRLELPLRAQASHSHVRWWPVDPRSPTVDETTVIGTEENSPVVRIQLAKGTYLRVYAKLRDRVRFEVVHKARDARCFGRFTADDLTSLYGWIDLAAADASDRVNRVLRSLGRYAQSPGYHHPPHQVAIAVLRALRDSTVGEDVLGVLVRDGRLVRSPRSNFGAAIDRLVNQGILEHVEQTGSDHLYGPTADYRDGLELLRQGASRFREG